MPFAELKSVPLFPFKDQYSADQVEYLESVPVRKVFPKGRLKNILPHEGFESLWDILQLTQRDFATIRHIGQKSRLELVSNTLYWLKDNNILPDDVDVNTEIKHMPEIKKEINYVESEEVFAYPEKYAGLSPKLLKTSIDEIPFCGRVEKALKEKRVKTVQDVLNLKWSEFNDVRGFGVKSKDDLIWKTEQWIKNHQPTENIRKVEERESEIDHYRMDLLTDLLSFVCEEMSVHQIKVILTKESSRVNLNGSIEKALKELLCGRNFNPSLDAFFRMYFSEGICSMKEFDDLLDSCKIFIRYPELKEIFFTTGVLRLKNEHVFLYRITLDEYLNYLSFKETDKSVSIFTDRLSGTSVVELTDKYNCSKQNIHLHLNSAVAKVPLLYEDYYAKVFQVSGVSREIFQKSFRDINDTAYEYLGLRYGKNESKYQKKTPLCQCKSRFADTLITTVKDETKQTVKDIIIEYFRESCTEPTSINNIQEDLIDLIIKKGKPIPTYINKDHQLKSLLRSTSGIVFNKEKNARYLDADMKSFWVNIDFSRYQNQVVSTVKIYNDNLDLMKQMDIRDGYELYSLIKNDDIPSSVLENSKLKFRRIPILVFGNGDEIDQALEFFKDTQNISTRDLCRAFNDKYGFRPDEGRNDIISAIKDYRLTQNMLALN